MKRYFSSLVLILVSTLLIACGDANPLGLTVDGESRDTALAAEEFMQDFTGDLDAMEQNRVVRVLTVYSVGHYYFDHGQAKGFIPEIIRLFEQYINKRTARNTLKVHVVAIPVARDKLIPALLEGRGDLIMASLSITPERQEILDFSIPVSNPVAEILVTGPEAPEVKSIEDLAGQKIYVRQSSSYRESLEELNSRLVSAGKKPVRIETVAETLEDNDLIEMVNAGLIPWAVVDDYKLQMWNGVFDAVRPRADIVFREEGEIAWAFRKDSPLLEAAVNGFLKSHREGTLVGNILINRYIVDFDWSKNALSKTDYDRFEALLDTFRKYGKEYEIDYLLAAAQGYQESGLDQGARSASGAIGIMQILPTTARDPNVGVSDIHLADNNIHAGMKYLNFLRSRYFSDPEIDHLNQTLMSLAAYNAGPARMTNLRENARKKGYDPNVWFDNVELVAASDVGQEPVKYVANIYKYYIAYSNAIRNLAAREAARQEAGIE
jgi:membrane-bound lytic murein transglycosylase MltF